MAVLALPALLVLVYAIIQRGITQRCGDLVEARAFVRPQETDR